MRAILTAILLTVATQAGADDAELNPDEWTFLDCKYADGEPLVIGGAILDHGSGGVVWSRAA